MRVWINYVGEGSFSFVMLKYVALADSYAKWHDARETSTLRFVLSERALTESYLKSTRPYHLPESPNYTRACIIKTGTPTHLCGSTLWWWYGSINLSCYWGSGLTLHVLKRSTPVSCHDRLVRQNGGPFLLSLPWLFWGFQFLSIYQKWGFLSSSWQSH